jgi:glycyl-tRNA synthetase (class II)
LDQRQAVPEDCFGIHFALTVDSDTLKDDKVTMIDLESIIQIRLPIAEVAHNINLQIAEHQI